MIACIDCGVPLEYVRNKKFCQSCATVCLVALRQNNRAAKVGATGTFTYHQWIDLCNQYGNICLRCGWNGPLTPDHVIPLDKQGTNDIGNIQPLCLRCNRRKHRNIVDYRNEGLDVRQARWEQERLLREKIAEQDAIRLATRPRSDTYSIQLDANGKTTGVLRLGHWSPLDEQWAVIEAVDFVELLEKMKVFK